MHNASINRGQALFLQTVVVLAGTGILAFLLIMPHFEGVNANAAGWRDVYFDDPFLAYVYVASIPFFVALFRACALLGRIGRGDLFSPSSVAALRTIKRCAFATAALVVGAGAIVAASHGDDDAAGFFALCIVATFASVVVGAAAAAFEKPLRSAVDMQAERELTV